MFVSQKKNGSIDIIYSDATRCLLKGKCLRCTLLITTTWHIIKKSFRTAQKMITRWIFKSKWVNLVVFKFWCFSISIKFVLILNEDVWCEIQWSRRIFALKLGNVFNFQKFLIISILNFRSSRLHTRYRCTRYDSNIGYRWEWHK